MPQIVSRRALLTGLSASLGLVALGGAAYWVGGTNTPIRLPGGQDEDRFIANCLRCDRCRSVCPEGCVTIQTVEEGFLRARTPKLDFKKGYCTFCNKCVEVCPTNALVEFDESREAVGIAVLDETECLAFTKSSCRVCADICAYEAIEIGAANTPSVVADRCNGCGACEFACPSTTYGSYSGAGKKGIFITPITQA